MDGVRLSGGDDDVFTRLTGCGFCTAEEFGCEALLLTVGAVGAAQPMGGTYGT
jgi:hypothetical protein